MHKIIGRIITQSFIIICANSSISNAATFNIAGTDTNNLSNSSIATGDVVDFAAGGTLAVDSNKTLDSITATTNNFGTIDFTTSNTLTITNDIGADPSNK
jgi:folate-dependent tRNA-U54 methylase TrmFO/GidA